MACLMGRGYSLPVIISFVPTSSAAPCLLVGDFGGLFYRRCIYVFVVLDVMLPF